MLHMSGSDLFPTFSYATALQVSVSKEHITIVGDGSTQADVEARVKQIKNLVAEVGAAALQVLQPALKSSQHSAVLWGHSVGARRCNVISSCRITHAVKHGEWQHVIAHCFL